MARGESIGLIKDESGNWIAKFGDETKTAGQCSIAELKSIRIAGKNRETKGEKSEGERMRIWSYIELQSRGEGVRVI